MSTPFAFGAPRPLLALLAGALLGGSALAAGQRHWVGGSGRWNDRSHWSATVNGPGGEAVPRAGDAVFIAAAGSELVVTLENTVEAGNLEVDGGHGGVRLQGGPGRMRLAGGLLLRGSVAWPWGGTLEMTASRGIAEIDARGIPMAGEMRFTGGGTWSMRSDLVLGEGAALELRSGTLVTNGNLLRAGSLQIADRGAKLMAGSSVVWLAGAFHPGIAREAVDPGSSRLVVAGVPAAWGTAAARGAAEGRGQNVCATGVGQTPFTINAQLLSNYNGFGVSCHGVCNGSVRVTVAGGTGPFTYNWVGGPAAATWNNVCPGNQIVIVTDQGQGVSCATTVQVTDPALLSVIFTGTQPPTCAGLCNGSSTVFAVGGVPGYGYSWNSGAGTGASFNQLCPGNNTLHVTDANNCAFDTTFHFPVQPIQPHLTKVNVHCAGACDGTASVAPTGGTGSFTYNWEPGTPAGDGTNAVSGLCAGSYTVNIRDVNGCDTTVQFQITQPLPLVPNATHVDATCAGSCNGTATVAPTGGSGNYGYSWSPAPGSGLHSATATGLCQGTYTVTITDNVSGCTIQVPVTIAAPPSIHVNRSSTNATCAGRCNGTASAPATGGSGALTYTWNPAVTGQGTPNATQLCVGTYSLTISDAAGCDTTVQFSITAPPPLVPAMAKTNVSCAGACDGTATATVTGGTGTISYNWAPGNPTGDGTASVTGLCAGNWSLTVTDANGCDTTVQVVITEPPPITVAPAQTNVTCRNVCDGTATVVVSGGTPAYTYAWSPVPAHGQGTATASGLCAGTWTVTVTDAHGCTRVHAFQILPAVPITANLQTTPASCAANCDGTASAVIGGGVPGYLYTWAPAPALGQGTPNASGLCAGPGTLTIRDAAGCDTVIAFIIGAPAPIHVVSTVTNISCPGNCNGSITLVPSGGSGPFSYSWTPSSAGTGPHIANLCPGTYQVVVASGGCDTTMSFTIGQPPPVDLHLASTNAHCAGVCDGAATITGNLAGFTFAWAPAPGAGQGTAHATGLCAGGYTVTATSAAGCDTVIAFTITAPPPVTGTMQVHDASCGTACDGSASVVAGGGSGGTYTYTWAPPPGSGQGTASVGGLCPGAYTVTVNDGAGCSTTLPFTIARPAGITTTAVVSPATCANTCDAGIIVSASGGVAPYTWNWVPAPGVGQGTSTVGGLCPGTWAVTVADQAGCDTTVSIAVGAPAAIDPHGSFTNETCNGPCDGTATVAPTGGTGAYTYNWSPAPPTGAGTATASGLCAGNWCVTVRDAAGCDTTWCFTILPASPVTATVDVTSSHCGACNGTAQLHPSGGSGTYTFHWGPPLNLSTSNAALTGLCAGVYAVAVSDGHGCSVQLAVAIADTDGETLTVANGTTSCPTTCDGSVAVAYNCGTAPCTTTWTDLTGTVLATGTDVLNGLCAGPYLVTVANGNGCIAVDTAVVIPPQPLSAAISSVPATCADACNGSATIGLQGGTGPFNITWMPVPGGGQGTPHATGLCPGTYSIQVHDQGGCDATFSVLITAPAAIAVAPLVANVSCSGQCDGSIELNPQGGSGTFTYVWSPAPPSGQGTPGVHGLCPGTYGVLVTDANGCDTTLAFLISEPLPLVLNGSATPGHCSLCDGTATLAVGGGSVPVAIQWTNGAGPVGSGSALTGLCAGVYLATATDAHGCTATRTVVVPDAAGEVIQAMDGLTYCAGACDGVVSVAYQCNQVPCTVSWFNSTGGLLAQGQDSLSGLCPGTYLVQVVNGAGCSTVDTAAVIPTQIILPHLSTTPVSCPGLCDGTATVGPTGGTGPYTFNWTPAPGGGQHTPHATGLCAGSYQVAIADAGGCDTLVNVLITAPQPLAVGAQVVHVSCNGACDGSIVLSPSGGSGFFTYAWAQVPPNGPGSNGAFNLCAGSWAVTVADINGCDTTLNFIISEPAPLSITTASTMSSCGVCNGTASATPAGGTAPYVVTWLQNGGILGTNSTVTGLCAGLYTVRVEDAHGCFLERVVSVTDPGGEVLTTTDFMLACPGQCNGVVGVAFNCTGPPCSTAWYDGAGTDLNEPGNTLANLCAGTYYVQVTNGAGCISIDTAQVTAPAPIVPNLGTTPVTCAGDCNGTATVGPTGGAGGYQYEWHLGTGTVLGTPQVTGLCAGTYSVIITDLAGCAITQDVLITAPLPITATAVVVPVTCHSACDASITVMGQGGTGPLVFHWAPEPPSGQGTSTITGLCAGAWTVLITDAHGCDTTFTLNLSDPPALVVDVAHTDNLCYTDCNATATATIAGGAAPYVITWTGPDGSVLAQNTPNVAGLCRGDHLLTVTDARGCSVVVPFTVASGAPIVTALVVQGESCHGPCDGHASVSVSGGSGSGFTYLWQPGNPAGQGTDQISALCPGNWSVLITDGLGCDTTSVFTVAPFMPITPVASVQQVQCNGACNGAIALQVSGGVGNLAYAWTPVPAVGQGTGNISGLCPGDHTVTITDAAGCDTTVSYAITQPSAITVHVDTVEAASCNTALDGAISITVGGGVPGYGIAWSGPNGFASGNEDINALLPGAYTVTVTDQNGCQVSVLVQVGALNSVVADAGPDRTGCAGAGVVLNGSASQGGTAFQWYNGQGAPISNAALVDLGALPAGAYTFVLTVSDGPCIDVDTLYITVLPMPIADAGPDRAIYVQGTVTLGGAPSGPPGSAFHWQPDSLLDHADLPNPMATVDTTTWFVLTVVSPDGCIGTDSVLITVVPEVKVPSGFTPNGDGHNDTWVLDFAVLFPEIDVKVFSRWGEPLFRSVGYHTPWDGKYDGKPVPMGTYYYAIELHDPRFPEALTGPLTVIR